jgi:sec-independent protein translocase protein TatB
MFDFSWTEIALIGGVALVVIGPKDLPKALRTAGIWVRKARSISREFQGTIEQMMREAELDEVKKTIEKATSFDVEKEIQKHVDPTGDLAEALKPPEMPDLDKLVAGADAKPADPAPPPPTIEPPASEALSAPETVPHAEPEPEPKAEQAEAVPIVHATPSETPVKPSPGDSH